MIPKKIMIIIVGVAFLCVIFGVFGIWSFVFSHANPPLYKTQITIKNLVFSAEVASSTVARARGLSGRDGLRENEGMLFLFNYSSIQNFWMKDMKFPIDIIWIGGGKVLGFIENASTPGADMPFWKLKIYSSPKNVDTVFEVNAGTVAKGNIKIGDLANISITK